MTRVTDEQRLSAIRKLMEFARKPNESVDAMCNRFSGLRYSIVKKARTNAPLLSAWHCLIKEKSPTSHVYEL